MRLLLALLTSIALFGCATGPVHLPVENLAASAKAPIEDMRPKNEGEREIFSLMITSDRYGYVRLAQDVTEPTGPRLFAHLLQEANASGTVPPTKLLHFAVYMNNRSELRTMALGVALGGVLGAVISSGTITREGEVVHTLVDASTFAALSGENEYKRAFYTDSELKSGTSAFVIFIESESQGKRRFTRTVSPIKPAQTGQKIPMHEALDAAIRFHLNS
ncbi:hypothetical protein os1_09230 [Comamonadaceae bacterium OS-1]|nr:hypothetical protein os1_09230 [Comamonadaceae bacterium OS-1]